MFIAPSYDMNPGVPHVQTKREIAELLESAGIRPRKSLGQHFLIDGNLMRRLAQIAQIGPRDVIVEVGAGTGGLTDLLVAAAGHVISVEIDHGLQRILTDRFADAQNFTLVSGDALAGKHHISEALAQQIQRHPPTPGGVLKLVSNLPYHAAAPLLIDLLLEYPAMQKMAFTVQAEVGHRLVASPGSKVFGPLGIIVQVCARPDIVAKVSPSVFWPRPQVESVMMTVDAHADLPIARAMLRDFATFVRSVFDHRRKTLRGALSYVLPEGISQRICMQFDGTRRPETFCVADWVRMFGLTECQVD